MRSNLDRCVQTQSVPEYKAMACSHYGQTLTLLEQGRRIERVFGVDDIVDDLYDVLAMASERRHLEYLWV